MQRILSNKTGVSRVNRYLALGLIMLPCSMIAQNVTITAHRQPMAEVFRTIMVQTGKNFVYSSEILRDRTVTITVKDKPLKKVLEEIFRGSDISFEIKGKNVLLKQHAPQKKTEDNRSHTKVRRPKIKLIPDSLSGVFLDELIVTSRLDAPTVATTEIGAMKVTSDDVKRMPALLGEPDVIKTLQMQPGISDGTEGLAGMHVHGGEADENLYMLDNVPIYQVNHFAGLFSAFNPDVIRYIDFYKSSIPAKYDGRLSSFMDVRLRNGNRSGHYGSAKLGLTSGAFNISGPIGSKASYLFGMRRSWYDVLTIPIMAIVSSKDPDFITRFRYHFMDLNAKVDYHFSNRLSGMVSVYYGDDRLGGGTKDKITEATVWIEDVGSNLHWGNIVAQTGVNYKIKEDLSVEGTLAFTRYFSKMHYKDINEDISVTPRSVYTETINTVNRINDWIARGDVTWDANDNSRFRFGAYYVAHSFLPASTERKFREPEMNVVVKDSTVKIPAHELNLFIEDEWRISDYVKTNIGLHGSLFHTTSKTQSAPAPRVSIAWTPYEAVALKISYSRTSQYVHQTSQTYLSLPTDQWLPVTGDFKPQVADKISFGFYRSLADNSYDVYVEGYWKWMRNLIEYKDDYFVMPPALMWENRLTTGKGTAKGIDVKIQKTTGRLTGYLAYSLAWADRVFPLKNGGKRYPARFDNRHTIKAVVNWDINDKVTFSASWVGHSGNHFTFIPQMWQAPDLNGHMNWTGSSIPLKVNVNNFQLPFYHRLDLSCNVNNSRGYWTFGLYNAYNHMNVVGVRRGSKVISSPHTPGVQNEVPTFQYIKLLPIIPSISYTWLF